MEISKDFRDFFELLNMLNGNKVRPMMIDGYNVFFFKKKIPC